MRVSVRVSIFLSFFHLVAFLLFDLFGRSVRFGGGLREDGRRYMDRGNRACEAYLRGREEGIECVCARARVRFA